MPYYSDEPSVELSPVKPIQQEQPICVILLARPISVNQVEPFPVVPYLVYLFEEPSQVEPIPMEPYLVYLLEEPSQVEPIPVEPYLVDLLEEPIPGELILVELILIDANLAGLILSSV